MACGLFKSTFSLKCPEKNQGAEDGKRLAPWGRTLPLPHSLPAAPRKRDTFVISDLGLDQHGIDPVVQQCLTEMLPSIHQPQHSHSCQHLLHMMTSFLWLNRI